jgi:hypothetical protein
MLLSAYRDIISSIATLSRLANRYRAIPYKFPTIVKVTRLSALLDALICCC